MINDGRGGRWWPMIAKGWGGAKGAKPMIMPIIMTISDHHQDDQNYESPLHLSTFLLPIPTQEITLSQNFKREDSYSLNTNSSSSSSPPFWKIIITGISVQACDNIAYLWDMRTGGYVQYFEVRHIIWMQTFCQYTSLSLSPWLILRLVMTWPCLYSCVCVCHWLSRRWGMRWPSETEDSITFLPQWTTNMSRLLAFVFLRLQK